MKAVKFLTTLSIITLSALFYVHAQIELVKLSYSIELKEKSFKELLDRKEALGYNIENLESPSRLESALSAQRIDVSFPKRAQFVDLRNAPRVKKSVRVARRDNRNKMTVAEWAGWRTEAHAKEK